MRTLYGILMFYLLLTFVYFLVYCKGISGSIASFLTSFLTSTEQILLSTAFQEIPMTHNFLEGILWILFFLGPLGTMAALWVLLLAVPVGRRILEGKSYDVSLASNYGDKGLTLIALIGAYIISFHQPIFVPAWLRDGDVHSAIYFVALMFCFIISAFTFKKREANFVDVFRDVVIAPVFILMIIVVVPVIYLNGTWLEKSVTVTCLMLWGVLGVVDLVTGRFNQQQWMRQQEQKRQDRRHFIFS